MKKPANPKERNLIKGAIRRVFSRSDLRREVIDLSRIDYTDPNRPRVTKWSRCSYCSKPTPTYLIEVDHVLPIVPIDKALEDLDWDALVNNVWCEIGNLRPTCKSCHSAKTKAENAERRRLKRGNKKG